VLKRAPYRVDRDVLDKELPTHDLGQNRLVQLLRELGHPHAPRDVGAGHPCLHHDRLTFFPHQRLAEPAPQCLAALDSLDRSFAAFAWVAAFAAFASLLAWRERCSALDFSSINGLCPAAVESGGSQAPR
jgi:hypothetical protein